MECRNLRNKQSIFTSIVPIWKATFLHKKILILKVI